MLSADETKDELFWIEKRRETPSTPDHHPDQWRAHGGGLKPLHMGGGGAQAPAHAGGGAQAPALFV